MSMLPIRKFQELKPAHFLRKAGLVLTELELNLHSATVDPKIKNYLEELASLIATRSAASNAGLTQWAQNFVARSNCVTCLDFARDQIYRRALNDLRHAVLRASGASLADWDLDHPWREEVSAKQVAHSKNSSVQLYAFFEDLRSPFNIGSSLRTADAFGLESIFLSPDCARPDHARAQRSAMGASIQWEYCSLADLAARSKEISGFKGFFGLELGGTPINEFEFPKCGMVLIGNEEFGLSAEARELCNLGLVSIPMYGQKASLNVGVAFGILAQSWRANFE